MKRVIYTSNFKTGQINYTSLEKWQIHALYRWQEYCDKIGVDLFVLDNMSEFNDIYKNLLSLSNWKGCRWSLATLGSIYCIHLFLQSNYDEMIWMDLDIIPVSHLNVFETLNQQCHIMKYGFADRDQPYMKKKIEFQTKFLGRPENEYCRLNAGTIKMTKYFAQYFFNTLAEYEIRITDYSNHARLIEYFKNVPRDGGYLCDECILECLPQNTYFTINKKIFSQYNEMTEKEREHCIANPNNYHFVHFPSNYKPKIVDFSKNVNN